jgi:hypothetical protein
MSKPALGPTQPPIQWVPGVKRQECEGDHSPPTIAEAKKSWVYTSTPPIRLYGDNFTFYVYFMLEAAANLLREVLIR